jgi:hypothetical protein
VLKDGHARSLPGIRTLLHLSVYPHWSSVVPSDGLPFPLYREQCILYFAQVSKPLQSLDRMAVSNYMLLILLPQYGVPGAKTSLHIREIFMTSKRIHVDQLQEQFPVWTACRPQDVNFINAESQKFLPVIWIIAFCSSCQARKLSRFPLHMLSPRNTTERVTAVLNANFPWGSNGTDYRISCDSDRDHEYAFQMRWTLRFSREVKCSTVADTNFVPFMTTSIPKIVWVGIEHHIL